MVKNTFRDLIYDPALGGGVIGGRAVKAIIPGGVSAPWFRSGPAGPTDGFKTKWARRVRCWARVRSWS